VLRGKFKYIHDTDDRCEGPDCRETVEDLPGFDDYEGNMFLGFGQLDLQWTNAFSTGVGYEFNYWDEENRQGSQADDFFEYETWINVFRGTVGYTFGGLTFRYLLEYFHKNQDRFAVLPDGSIDDDANTNQAYRVWRAKATVEVGF